MIPEKFVSEIVTHSVVVGGDLACWLLGGKTGAGSKTVNVDIGYSVSVITLNFLL